MTFRHAWMARENWSDQAVYGACWKNMPNPKLHPTRLGSNVQLQELSMLALPTAIVVNIIIDVF